MAAWLAMAEAEPGGLTRPPPPEEDDVESTGSQSGPREGVRGKVAAPAVGGNLFLTCLRLRFEERGSWTQALQPAFASAEAGNTGQPAEAAEPVLADITTANECSESRIGPASERGSWRERAGLPPRGSTRALLRRLLLRRPQQHGTAEARHPVRAAWPPAFGIASEALRLSPGLEDSDGSPGAQHTLWQRARPYLVARCQGSSEMGGVVITAAPLRPLPSPQRCQANSSSVVLPAVRRAYYYELEVVENLPGRARSLSLGFFWRPELLPGGLPSAASQLPRSVIVGGEPSRALLCGKTLCEVGGWRPALRLAAGSTLGVLLEVRSEVACCGSSTRVAAAPALLRLVIFQDGAVCAELRTEVSADGDAERVELHAALKPRKLSAGPYAVVDIGGGVRSVRLRAAVGPPARAVSRSRAAAV